MGGEEETRSVCVPCLVSVPWSEKNNTFLDISGHSGLVYSGHISLMRPQDSSEYVQFLRESHGQALKEEERRYRFLAEKHCGLVQSISRLMNKVYRLL